MMRSPSIPDEEGWNLRRASRAAAHLSSDTEDDMLKAAAQVPKDVLPAVGDGTPR